MDPCWTPFCISLQLDNKPSACTLCSVAHSFQTIELILRGKGELKVKLLKRMFSSQYLYPPYCQHVGHPGHGVAD